MDSTKASTDSQSTSQQHNNESANAPKQQEPFFKPFTKKNWDAIIDEFEKEEEQDKGVNDLFKQIYESGSDEVKKAMNKSYQESGGTVLSTNWENVATGKVEPKPPRQNDEADIKDDGLNNLLG